MPKMIINGVTREMEPEEIAFFEAQDGKQRPPEPTHEERMTEIEAALIELAAMLTGGV